MTNKPPVLHIVVVGFHHKLGCQVEFSYPPLIAGTTGKNECPSGWKYLPTLALPDGSHNFTEDTIFFNLPSLMEPSKTIFGASCYRQIPVEKLKIRTADVTRSSVQKSVCVLTRLPIYGYIEVKLALIADAFFEQGDFTCTDILMKAYKQLNACLMDEVEIRRQRHFYTGLNLREIVLQWRHKTLILFKLFLLQRRVICFCSPVRRMCVLILGIASLMPRLLEKGFQEVACVRTSRPISPMPDFTDCIQREIEKEIQQQQQESQDIHASNAGHFEDEEAYGEHITDDEKLQNDVGNKEFNLEELVREIPSNVSIATTAAAGDNESRKQSIESKNKLQRLNSTESCSSGEENSAKRLERSDSMSKEMGSVDTLNSTLGVLSAINPDEYRAPVTIFASGNLCLPYLSLPYMDLLTDPSVLSYVIGTSNVLFQQKRQLADVLIDIENTNIEIAASDSDLRRQLVLSTEDLRFMDFIMKHVQMPKEDAEGSEHWIRDQFQAYILALLRTAVANDATTKDNDHFNSQYMNALKRTQCYQEWYDVRPDSEFFASLPSGHPFAGSLSVADMKLKIAQTMQNSESGRKLNQAVNNTSRAVGGAISQAKGAFSNWWSSFSTVPQMSPESGAAGGDGGENTFVKSSSQSSNQNINEISVTFQNSNDECNIEMGVSINIEEPLPTQQQQQTKSTNISRNTSSASSAGGGSEKLLDSAEELEEDSIKSNVDDDSLHKKQQQQQAVHSIAIVQNKQQQKGIVEIGKEAAMAFDDEGSIRNAVADKTEAEKLKTTSNSNAATLADEAVNSNEEISNSNNSSSDVIFVV